MEIRAIQLRMIIEWMDIKASEKQKKNATRRKKAMKIKDKKKRVRKKNYKRGNKRKASRE